MPIRGELVQRISTDIYDTAIRVQYGIKETREGYVSGQNSRTRKIIEIRVFIFHIKIKLEIRNKLKWVACEQGMLRVVQVFGSVYYGKSEEFEPSGA